MSETLIVPINIAEFTDNVSRDDVEHVVSGTGIFDTMMETATQHLKAQFEGNRFREEDYATAYVQIYQATLQAALQIWLEKGVAEKRLELLTKQMETETNKAALYLRQIESFDESYKEKILKMMLETWGVGFSVASDAFDTVPQPMTHTSINNVFTEYILPDLEKYKYPRPANVTVIK